MPHPDANLRTQWRRSRFVLALAIVPATAVVGAVAVLSQVQGFPVERLFSDPLAQAGAHPLLGFVSNLGILLWSAAAGACLVAALVLRHGTKPGEREAARFFVVAAALTAILVLDDTFQFHEDLVERLVGRGQTFVLLGYVAIVAAFVVRFRRFMSQSRWVILAIAGVFFAVSIGVDLYPVFIAALPGDMTIDTETDAYDFVSHVVEDGSKFIGIALWFAYFTVTAASELKAPVVERDIA
jgi:hypothetical protein